MSAVRDLLEGKPLRSPLHPILVHLPIGLFPLALLLDAASWLLGGEHTAFVRGAYYSHLLGLATAVIAALFGLVDYSEVRRDHPARAIATRHMILNFVAVGLFAASAWFRRDAVDVAQTPALPLVLTLVGVAVLSYSGYLGGQLVYDDGIGVGRHRRPGPLPDETLVNRGGQELVSVGDDAALKEGRTLRAEVNGVVITIARSGGGLFAFQEFCTHRYGPLSEGRVRDCEVTCPWHRSRFDVRTGKVTSGPAKVDLRTFRVEARDGKIWVEAPKREQ